MVHVSYLHHEVRGEQMHELIDLSLDTFKKYKKD